jgi:tetratricopeptide (TPR) repeat protein
MIALATAAECQAVWRARPVFISSTFEDMQAERDHLRNFVFPELEERLRGRRHHLEWVDLRLGVATAAQADERARELQVLKVCLSEVRRCRPYLIALIGDRYGWVPPVELITAAAAEEGFAGDVAGRSVTDLEIEFGVLSDPEQQRRSFFYFRDPLPSDRMPPAIAAMYAEAHAGAGAADRVERLGALKRRIEARLPNHVRRYSAYWDGDRQRVTNLDAWGRLVLEDIWAQLAADTADAAEEPDIPWQQTERNALLDFAEDRARDFIGRGQVIGKLTVVALSPVEDRAMWGVCVTGEAGSGKSALFGELYRRFAHTDAFVLAHAAGASLLSASVDSMLHRFVEELARALGVDAGLAENANPEAIEATFAALLRRMAEQRRVLVLIDALDQFEAATRGLYVTWLPRPWPINARLVATGVPGQATIALSERSRVELLPLPPLDMGEARAIAEAVCARYHRILEPQVLDALIGKANAARPAWENPLWLVLAVEELNLLDADDFGRAKRSYSGALAERLRSLMLDVVAALPVDVPGIYDATFARAEELFGANLARAFVGLIAVSRAGWRESDFRILLPRASGEFWDELRFASLRRLFRGQLRQRGALGQWDFSHAQMRAAARRRVASDGVGEATLHAMIADHLLSRSPNDPLHQTEAMVHLIASENIPRAAAYYGDEMLSPAELEGATRAIADTVLTSSTDGPVAVARDAAQLLDAAGLDAAVTGRTAHRFLFDLDGALAGRASLDARVVLIDRSGEAFARLLRQNSTNAIWQRDLWACHIKVGELLMAAGNREKALTAFVQSLAIAKKGVAESRLDAEWQSCRATSCAHIADVLAAAGRRDEAMEAYAFALSIEEKLCAADPEDVEWQRNLSATLNKIGDLQVAAGRRKEALAAYQKDLAIAEKLVARVPENVERLRDLSVSQDCVAEMLAATGRREEALAIYRQAQVIREKLAARDPGNTALQRDLWVIYTKIGDLFGGAAQHDEALVAHYRALAIIAKLARVDPGNAQWQRDLTASQNNVGDALMGLGRRTEAFAAYQNALAIAERLAAADPANVIWQRDLSISFMKVADILVREQPDAAVVNYQRSRSIVENLAAVDPENRRWHRDLCAAWLKLGDALIGAGDLDHALAAFREAIAISEELATADPDNVQWQRDVSVSHSRLGDLLAKISGQDEALASYRKAHAISERLATDDPTNVLLQRDLATDWDRLRKALISAGKGEEVLDPYRRALATAQERAAADPGNRDLERELALAYSSLGDPLASLGRRAEALAAYQTSMAIREKLAATDSGPAGTAKEPAK